ncbi:MAG: Gfo/Idh/MocA family oxidoreductase, partial [Pirellulales bacterium]|nr:Gfo/Idh/MocA family oxidoreductase [Pirellulales bacterium]
TTTHARAWCVIQCLKRGIDTYIEKPMCLTIEEGRAMVDAARKYKCVTQVGTQQRSIPLNNWACDLIQAGAIGKVRVVEAPNFIGPMEWDDKPAQQMPDGGSDDWWDIWTNAAELRPYHQELHYGWARWSDYDAGGLCFGVSGWGTHSYDQVQRGLGTSDTAPTAILLEEKMETRDSGRFGQRQIGDDETGAPYYGMAKLSGPRARITMRYANGAELRLHLDGDRGPGLGCIFVGTSGKIEVNRDKISANPKQLLAGDDRPKTLGELGFSETQPHIQNWLDCIKSREKANADVEYGHYSTMICNLVNAVRETGLVGKTLQWDPKAERFTNCDEANENRWIKRPRRKGYELDV